MVDILVFSVLFVSALAGYVVFQYLKLKRREYGERQARMKRSSMLFEYYLPLGSGV
jgi:hypothetical protein